MTVAETLLVFVGAPLAVIVVLALLIFLPAGRAKRSRYKPGQPWDHAPVWYEPHPEHGPAAADGETLAIGSSVYGERYGEDARATHVVSGGTGHGVTGPGSVAHGAATQGATAAHGATVIGDGAGAPRSVSAGPLGGARGTW